MKVRIAQILDDENKLIRQVDLVLDIKRLTQAGTLEVYKALSDIKATTPKEKKQ